MDISSRVRWPLLLAIVFGAQMAAAQRPLPDGAEGHPSYYHYPLQTWTQSEPNRLRFAPRDRVNSNAFLTHKLQSIVLLRIHFDRTSVATVIDFLRRESLRYDPDPNPETRGVDIFLRSPKSSSATSPAATSLPGLPSSLAWPTPSDSNGLITGTMGRMSLLEALRSVASLAGLKVAVEPYAVSLVPQDYVVQNLVTAEYGVPPELLGREEDPGGFCPRVNLEAWLEAKGIDFPAGASAVYLTSARLLIVRNTSENLDKIVSVISSALKPADPTPATP